MSFHYEFTVIGGGLVGAAVAYGLTLRGAQVALLDEGDIAFRASRGNFGLVWVQGKGLDFPQYSDWSRQSAGLWPGFAAELKDLTGIDVVYRRPGGVQICLDEAEFEQRHDALIRLQQQTQNRFSFEMLDRAALSEWIPAVSPDVVGGSYCPLDGHCNPLYLLRALHAGFLRLGGTYLANRTVSSLHPTAAGFEVGTPLGSIGCDRLVLAAGLGNRELAPQLGLLAPLVPNRGQILVTEKLRPLLNLPTVWLRQTAEGGMMIGDSHEEAGFDTRTSSEIMTAIARRAVQTFPLLRQVRLVRTWAALRVMTPDGIPIYQESASCPGAFIATCHSGVTLAASHALKLPRWLLGEDKLNAVRPFHAERFG